MILMEEHYGTMVWVSKEIELLRKTDCLCLNCKLLTGCNQAITFYRMCAEHDLAIAVTRCPKFKHMSQVHVWGCAEHGSWYANTDIKDPICPICGYPPSEDYGEIP